MVILVAPPSRADQAARLRGRGDDATEIDRRLAAAEEEEAAARALADHVVVNEDLSRAVEEVAGILHQRRLDRPGPRGISATTS